MDVGREGGGREALGRATQSRLQMCRQQQSGCFGPHQAALGVSPAHVPTPPVNQSSQASGSTAATKPLRPDPLNGPTSDRRTPLSPLRYVRSVTVSVSAWLGSSRTSVQTLNQRVVTFSVCAGTFARQAAAAYRSEKNAAWCRKSCRRSSFSATTARLPCCSLVSLAPGHSFNSTQLPIRPIHSGVCTVLFTQLQIPAGCECVCNPFPSALNT